MSEANAAAAATLEGTWVPVAAALAGSELAVSELRVRYLLLAAGTYRIVDCSNQIVDSGDYVLGDENAPAQLDIIGRSGANAGRTLHASFTLNGDALRVCYDLQGGARPLDAVGAAEQLVLRIDYTRAVLGAAGAPPPVAAR